MADARGPRELAEQALANARAAMESPKYFPLFARGHLLQAVVSLQEALASADAHAAFEAGQRAAERAP